MWMVGDNNMETAVEAVCSYCNIYPKQ